MRSVIRANMTGDFGLSAQGACFGPLGLILGGVGALVSAAGTLAGGAAQSNALKFQAQQEQQAANESRASGQRQQIEQERKGALVQSQLQANAAASGAGATDPTVLNLGSDIAGRSKYQELMIGYDAESRARGLEDQAAASRYGAKNARIGSYFGAAGTIIGGAGGMFDKYNKLYGDNAPGGSDYKYG